MNAYQPYHKKKPYLLVLVVVIILLAVFISFSPVRNLFGVRSFLQAVIYPFQFAAVSVWKGVAGFPGAVGNLRNLSKENAQLKNELKNIKPQLIALKGIEIENERLRSVLRFKQNSRYGFRLLSAQVIGRSPTPWFSILEINQGKQAGVKVDKPVIVKEGVVGRVIEVSKYTSKVMLLTDAGSTLAAADARSRDYGLVEGSMGGRLSMKYVSAGGDISAGDQIITSQISLIFPANLPIGTVTKASKGERDLFYHIEVKPTVDFSKLEEVFIIL